MEGVVSWGGLINGGVAGVSAWGGGGGGGGGGGVWRWGWVGWEVHISVAQTLS